jgi:hypothetical protein
MKEKIYVIIITGICLLTIFTSSQALNVNNTEIEDSQFLEKSFLNKQTENRATIYYASAQVYYEKGESGSIPYYTKRVSVLSFGTFHCFDANLENFVLEIVMNYTAEMDFKTNSSSILAPIISFGLKIDNYTDYVWESFKLKHSGYVKRQGNISIEIQFDMDNIKSGDKFLLDPTIAIVGDPLVYTSKDLQIRKFTSILLRFAYHIPSQNKYLLNKIILPFIAEHDYSSIQGELTKICILFE